jgi:hypothetical protein
MKFSPTLLIGLTFISYLFPIRMFSSEMITREDNTRKSICGFSELKLPSEFSVFASGIYSGREIAYQIDQSGHQGTQVDVVVNSPQKPVVLILGAYEPTVWNIKWSQKTKVLAVLVGGYHRQVIAGLEKSTPTSISFYRSENNCGYSYFSPDQLGSLNPLARSNFGRPVDLFFPIVDGKVTVGEPISTNIKLITSPETSPESFYDKSAPIAGLAGIEDAIRKGLIRRATSADAKAWVDTVTQNSPPRDIPPIAGKGIPEPPMFSIYNTYVILKKFTYPAGLYGGNSVRFVIPKGVPNPEGNPGHSDVLDFSTLTCKGSACGIRP